LFLPGLDGKAGQGQALPLPLSPPTDRMDAACFTVSKLNHARFEVVDNLVENAKITDENGRI